MLALLAGATLACASVTARPAHAQVRPDSTRRDTARVVVPVPDRLRDSLRADSLRRAAATTGARANTPQPPRDTARARRDSLAYLRVVDTIKAPMARFDAPENVEITDRLRFSREQILSSGAVNMADLLDRVPGVTSFRSGWIAGAHGASYLGEFRRIRYFLDGMELDAIQPREGGVLDLTDVPLWTLDEIVIERAAGETRVWMRSWSTDKTTPYTRADIFTGDLNTNGFRALFARRYRNGMILQFGGEQAATQTGRASAFGGTGVSTRGDGSVQTVNVRIGWARGLWSTDVYATGVSRDRDPLAAREGFLNLAPFKGSRREAFLRVAYGDTARGLWSHAVLGLLRTRLEGVADTLAPPRTAEDTTPVVSLDTVAGRTQQMIAAGYRAPSWEAVVLDRMRPIGGSLLHAPAVRASLGPQRYRIGAFAELNQADSTRRVDLSARLQPLPWLVLTAGASDRAPLSGSARPTGQTLRAEAGVRWRGNWFGGGVIRADSVQYDPSLFYGGGVVLAAPGGDGVTASFTGRLYKDLRLDVQAISWNRATFGRPSAHVRAELTLISNWLSRFPKGEFGIDARIIHDVRERVAFLYGALEDGSADIRYADRMPLTTGQLQIRIQRASLFYQYRNLTGRAYEQVAGLTLPPAVQLYGVRWEFFN